MRNTAALHWTLLVALLIILLAVACLVLTLRVGGDGDAVIARTIPVTVMPGTTTSGNPTPVPGTDTSIAAPPAAAWIDAPGSSPPIEESPAEETPGRSDADQTADTIAPQVEAGGGDDDAPDDPAGGTDDEAVAVGAVASVPSGDLAETYTVSTWSDFTARLDGLVVRWGSASGTNRFKVVVTNESEYLTRTMHVVVYARNDTLSPPRREVWPATIVDDEAYPNPTGSLLSGTIRRSWHERGDRARGRKLSLGPGKTTEIGASLPLRARSQHESWRGEPMEPVGFIEFLLWVFDGRSWTCTLRAEELDTHFFG